MIVGTLSALGLHLWVPAALQERGGLRHTSFSQGVLERDLTTDLFERLANLTA